MRLIFYSKCSKFNINSKNVIKVENIFSIFYITAYELAEVNSPFYYENTRSWQSMF